MRKLSDFCHQSSSLLWCETKNNGKHSNKVRLVIQSFNNCISVCCEKGLTRISLCSRNCMMTFLRYSKLTSSSDD